MSKNEMAQADPVAKAKEDGLRLLAFRPRSSQELRSRLLRKKHGKEPVEAAIDFFQKKGFLDDEKFAKLYALSRVQSKAGGKKQIQFDLKTKGVPPQAIERALEAIEDFDENQMALDAAQKRFQGMKGVAPRTAKQRLYGFLQRRGFSSGAVFYALSKLIKDGESFE